MKYNYSKSDFSETWQEQGLIVQVISPKVKKVTLEIAQQLIIDRVAALGEDSPSNLPVLVYVNNAISVDSQAKKLYETGDPYKNIPALAMVMNNYISRAVGNLVFLFDKQPIPISFFNSKDKAINWLNSFKS